MDSAIRDPAMIGGRVFYFSVNARSLVIENQESPDHSSRPCSIAQAITLALATLWGISLSAKVIEPFVSTLTWALTLAVLAHPIYALTKRIVPHSSSAAIVTTSVAALIIFIPAYWVGSILLQATVEHALSLLERSSPHSWLAPSEAPPHLAKILAWIEESLHLQTIIIDLIHNLAQRLPRLLTISLLGALQIALVIFTTFFFIRDGERFLDEAKKVLPFPPHYIHSTALRILDTVHATLFGIVLMSILQGFLGGMIFWWLGLPRAVLWGTIMGLLAILPYLGAFVVWVPAALALAMDGEWDKAVFLTFWGTIVIGLSDNLLYPILVGHRMHYHTLIIFLFLCGGLLVFGAAGVILGPIILTLTHTLIVLWREGEAATR